MKILYGVQATGNGHLSRAREMARHFANSAVKVEYLISGRPKHKLHDMELFGDYKYCHGITFQTQNGSVRALDTIASLKPLQLIEDIKSLNISDYDLVISDFEPVTAWAAKLNGKKCIGIGHQYAFEGPVPRAKGKWFSNQVMKHFAPADLNVGLHWDRFNSNILPPIISPRLKPGSKRSGNKIVVYLPFENQDRVTRILKAVPGYQFFQYAPGLDDESEAHVELRAPSVEGFHADLSNCSGVICNSGFELISECLQLGIPVLTTPLSGQVEQLSNAIALETLDLAKVESHLESEVVYNWLDKKRDRVSAGYPDVAKALVSWIEGGFQQPVEALSASLWGHPYRQATVESKRANTLKPAAI